MADTDNTPPTGPDARDADGGRAGSTAAVPAEGAATPDGAAATDDRLTSPPGEDGDAPTTHDDAAPATRALPVSQDRTASVAAPDEHDEQPADSTASAGPQAIDEPKVASGVAPSGTDSAADTDSATDTGTDTAADTPTETTPTATGSHSVSASASAGSVEASSVDTDTAAGSDERASGAGTDGNGADAAGTDAAVVPTPAGRGTPASKDDPGTDAQGSEHDRDAARRAAVRDGVITARPAFPRFLQVVVALFFPIIVVAAAVRAVATSSFLWIEYHRPGFPADSFGFSLEDRMTYGSYALDYVLNFAPARYLGDLVTPEGAPLFLESEVGHMADVKGVLGVAFAVALVMFVLVVLACVHLARRYKGGIRRALFAGAVITLVGIVALAVLAITAWEAFFTQVHALFFSEGTWTFRVDDTLIRLFPEQFWTDSAVVVGLLVLLATLLTLVLTWPTRARRERSKRAQEAEQMRYLESLKTS